MATGLPYCTIIAAACILLPGCAGTPQTGTGSLSADLPMPAAMDPGSDPHMDHFIAQLPYSLADTATQARAMTHVAIGRAKASTGMAQCDRPWLLTGPASDSVGPYLTVKAGIPASWYYRVSHRPGQDGCDNTSRDALYESLQESLPAWITLLRAARVAPETVSAPLVRASR